MKKEFIFFDINKTATGHIMDLFDSGPEDKMRTIVFTCNYSGLVRFNYPGCVFAYCFEYEFDGIQCLEEYYMRKTSLMNGHGKWVIIQRIGYDAPYMLGGPIEEKGRLKYIDGCSDSLLLSPLKKGDPCMNHLHFPKNINQTMHTHPTLRAGIVARGEGICRWIDEAGQLHHTPLRPGLIWVIPPDVKHAFQTFDKAMDVIAYHPDSDFGPTDEEHPMINRTYVNGISANLIPDIQTKEIV